MPPRGGEAVAAGAVWLSDDAGFMGRSQGVGQVESVRKNKNPSGPLGHGGFGERRYVALAYTRRSRVLLQHFTATTVTRSAALSTSNAKQQRQPATPIGGGERHGLRSRP